MSIDGIKNIVILGATGSIGDSTLDIIARNPNKFKVVAITGHSNIEKLASLCNKFNPKYAITTNQSKYQELKQLINSKTKVLAGKDEVNSICQLPEVDMVVAGIVGSAGMESVLATVSAGKDLLLANKEALVVAGDLVMQTAKNTKAKIIPLDSEHNAIYQCLPDDYVIGTTPKNLDKIILTASGGPFWNVEYDEFHSITPERACAHPRWKMGRKISVDSATMMNKGLEIIEAHWLFNLASEKIDVHVHPQSVIHSMVCYKDGSVIAQMGDPDMRIPIAYGLGMRERITSGANMLDLLSNNILQFYIPNYIKFPSLDLARGTINTGGTSAAILNAANEVSVDAFLNKRISFLNISKINQSIMSKCQSETVESVEQLLALDTEIRSITQQMVKQYA